MRVLVGVAAATVLAAGCTSTSHCVTAFRRGTAERVSIQSTTGAMTAAVSQVGLTPDPSPTAVHLGGVRGQHLATVQGTAVLLGSDRQLRGIRLADLRQVWNSRRDHQLLARLAVVSGSVVYAAGAQAGGEPGDRVYAIAVRTGRLLWSRTLLLDTTVQRLAVVGGRLLTAVIHPVSRAHAELGSLDLQTGDARWTTTLPRRSVVRLAGSGDRVLVFTADPASGCD